ncbi:MAG: sensor histidine kinase, partial [Erysipelotrichaceae bacterium]|nr:sensor histidine kinase [Erysipelotrichaceae bacterium]
YLMYFPTTTRVMCVFFTNILASLNVVLFLGFLIVSLLKQQRERDKIQEELEFVSQINTQLKDYTALSQLDIEDNERKRISREIHDTLGHALTGMSAGLDACIVLLDLDKDKAREQLLVLSKVVKDGIKDVRRSLNKLRPGVLEDLSLKEAIVKLCEDSEQTSNIFVNLYYEWEDLDLEKTKEDIIYRIVQESITNAVRHGKAGEVDVEFFKEHDKYMIVIQDDGKGTNEIKDGYGLKQMKERVAILNGVIHFVSEEGKGFRTVVEIRQ